ncbi:MAG: hypothetical protein NT062_12595 [Proteobacteria bacterium]|nr:hypothetical protein [Pseudomonadota bacterium]
MPQLLPAAFAAIMLAACSGPAKPATTTADHGHQDTSELGSCTDASTVRVGATNCKLDLGTKADSHWADTDGVDPGTAGCHEEFTDATCTTHKEGRTFGELCLDDDRLVESNPGAGVCHTHAGDFGKPAVVSCAAWCKAEKQATTGRCEAGVEAKSSTGTCQSARCACS